MARRRRLIIAAVAALTGFGATSAYAASCSSTGAAFESWKSEFAAEAKANGVGAKGLAALAGTKYSTKTINADRNQKSFKLSFDQFMAKRGGNSIISKGKGIKNANAALFASIEKRYGVPAGPLIAIWGMETGFGGFMGNQNTVSAVATLAYDALKLVDRGVISASSIGAMHGEVGQTQFLPKNVFNYGADGDGDGRIDLIRSKADALASTAKFLKGHGWSAGGGYQPGQGNFGAIQGWNAAGVYQKAIAYIGAQIDGG
jgi:membrane-bound lytic murein transglycosylase B